MRDFREFAAEQSRSKRAGRVRLRVFVGVVVMAMVGLLVTWFFFRAEVLEQGSNLAEKVGQPDLSEELERRAFYLGWEEEARKSFGTEVVWVEFPEDQASAFSNVVAKHIADSKVFSQMQTPSGKVISCISEDCAAECVQTLEDCLLIERPDS